MFHRPNEQVECVGCSYGGRSCVDVGVKDLFSTTAHKQDDTSTSQSYKLAALESSSNDHEPGRLYATTNQYEANQCPH